MKGKMTESAKTALAVVAVIALGIAFWFLLLEPKREKASELGKQVASLKSEVSTERQRVLTGLEAKEAFPHDYQQLILLGKAVPAEAATPSLLVQLNGVGARANAAFNSIKLSEEEEGEGEAVPAGAAADPTEAAAALLPIGAAVGSAGLPALPYNLVYDGGYFEIADFLGGLDSLVETRKDVVDADGRLITIDGFKLTPRKARDGKLFLQGSFEVTAYSTPPNEGLTAGATEAGPAPSIPVPSIP